jgi:hypothetical protein
MEAATVEVTLFCSNVYHLKPNIPTTGVWTSQICYNIGSVFCGKTVVDPGVGVKDYALFLALTCKFADSMNQREHKMTHSAKEVAPGTSNIQQHRTSHYITRTKQVQYIHYVTTVIQPQLCNLDAIWCADANPNRQRVSLVVRGEGFSVSYLHREARHLESKQ